MDRCSSHGNTVDSCSCGLFHTHQANSFSMLVSMPNNKPTDDMYAYPITSSSSSVDCTLSLGTPSTRQIDEKYTSHHQQSGSCIPNFCCDIFQTKQSPSSTLTHKTSQGGSSSSNSGSILNNLTGDPLLARRCANCDTTSTPLWRNGPRGPKSLCNACGIRYKKEERRATTTTTISSTNMAAACWHHSQTQKVSSISPSISNELRLIEDDDRDPNSSIPFLSLCECSGQTEPCS